MAKAGETSRSPPRSGSQAGFAGLANPARFVRLADRLIPWGAVLSALMIAAGLWLVFFVVPADYQQGDSVRIMYIHVPSAWLSLMFYTMMAVSAFGTLVWRHPLADVAQKAAAPIGACFTFICLVSGSIWGKPMWGAWWVWDARLTSELVLLLLYLGIIGLWRAFDEPSQAARPVAVLTLVGFINVPIIKFSVDWWNTLHQPASVFRLDGPSIAPAMLWPLLFMAVALTCLALTLHLLVMRTDILRRRVRRLERMRIESIEHVKRTGTSVQGGRAMKGAG